MYSSGGKWSEIPYKWSEVVESFKMRKRRMDAMFMGEYNHSIDAKGRMIVPAKFREQLGNEFVVTKGLMAVCSSIPMKNGIALRKISVTNHSHQEKQENL